MIVARSSSIDPRSNPKSDPRALRSLSPLRRPIWQRLAGNNIRTNERRLLDHVRRIGRVGWCCFALVIGGALPSAASAASLDQGLRAYQARDYTSAFSTLSPWAESGHPEAQFTLGQMYARGHGVIQSYLDAHKWFNLAASAGHPRAGAQRDAIASRMTSTQVARAQRQARLWTPKRGQVATTSPSVVNPPSAPRATRVASISSTELARRVQSMLGELGYDPGPADGRPGSGTRRAVQSYQSHSGLPVDGRITERLHDSLASDLGRPTLAESRPVRPSSTTTQPRTRSYGTPSSNRLAIAMEEVDQVADSAERRRAASPDIVERLREIVRRYAPPTGTTQAPPRAAAAPNDTPWRSPAPTPAPTTPAPQVSPALTHVIFRDSFADGDYDNRPGWRVRSGSFYVDTQRRLRTEVQSSQPTREGSNGDLPLAIIGAILGQSGNSSGASTSPATIDLPTAVPADFRVESAISTLGGDGAIQLTMLSTAGPASNLSVRLAFEGTKLQVALVKGDRTVLGQTMLQRQNSAVTTVRIAWRQFRGKAQVQLNGRPILNRDVGTVSPYNTVRITNLLGNFAIDDVELSKSAAY